MANNADRQYLELVDKILSSGKLTENRTGTDTIGIFGHQMRFDLNEGFPALTIKKLNFQSVVGELLWFIEGSDDERRLAEITFGRDRSQLTGKTTIWTANANAQGRALGYTNNDDFKGLGPIYGVQWRSWESIDPRTGGIRTTDQFADVVRKLRYAPNDRRNILTAYNVGELEQMALPPCHCFANFRVYDGVLNCLMYQRSADVALGVPYNIASYALLTHLLARHTGLDVGEFIHTLGDAHLYSNHIEPMKQILNLEPYELPTLKIANHFDLDWGIKDKRFPLGSTDLITLDSYQRHPSIKMEMAI